VHETASVVKGLISLEQARCPWCWGTRTQQCVYNTPPIMFSMISLDDESVDTYSDTISDYGEGHERDVHVQEAKYKRLQMLEDKKRESRKIASRFDDNDDDIDRLRPNNYPPIEAVAAAFLNSHEWWVQGIGYGESFKFNYTTKGGPVVPSRKITYLASKSLNGKLSFVPYGDKDTRDKLANSVEVNEWDRLTIAMSRGKIALYQLVTTEDVLSSKFGERAGSKVRVMVKLNATTLDALVSQMKSNPWKVVSYPSNPTQGDLQELPVNVVYMKPLGRGGCSDLPLDPTASTVLRKISPTDFSLVDLREFIMGGVWYYDREHLYEIDYLPEFQVWPLTDLELKSMIDQEARIGFYVSGLIVGGKGKKSKAAVNNQVVVYQPKNNPNPRPKKQKSVKKPKAKTVVKSVPKAVVVAKTMVYNAFSPKAVGACVMSRYGMIPAVHRVTMLLKAPTSGGTSAQFALLASPVWNGYISNLNASKVVGANAVQWGSSTSNTFIIIDNTNGTVNTGLGMSWANFVLLASQARFRSMRATSLAAVEYRFASIAGTGETYGNAVLSLGETNAANSATQLDSVAFGQIISTADVSQFNNCIRGTSFDLMEDNLVLRNMPCGGRAFTIRNTADTNPSFTDNSALSNIEYGIVTSTNGVFGGGFSNFGPTSTYDWTAIYCQIDNLANNDATFLAVELIYHMMATPLIQSLAATARTSEGSGSSVDGVSETMLHKIYEAVGGFQGPLMQAVSEVFQAARRNPALTRKAFMMLTNQF